jgi:hypothetical protein
VADARRPPTASQAAAESAEQGRRVGGAGTPQGVARSVPHAPEIRSESAWKAAATSCTVPPSCALRCAALACSCSGVRAACGRARAGPAWAPGYGMRCMRRRCGGGFFHEARAGPASARCHASDCDPGACARHAAPCAARSECARHAHAASHGTPVAGGQGGRSARSRTAWRSAGPHRGGGVALGGRVDQELQRGHLGELGLEARARGRQHGLVQPAARRHATQVGGRAGSSARAHHGGTAKAGCRSRAPGPPQGAPCAAELWQHLRPRRRARQDLLPLLRYFFLQRAEDAVCSPARRGRRP